MNKKIKSIISIILIFISIGIFSGCTNNSSQIIHSFIKEDIKSVDIIVGKFKKIVDEPKDIDLIRDLLNSINGQIDSNHVALDGWKFEFKLINQDEELVDEIIIYKDYLSYNAKIYNYDNKDNLYNEIYKLYEQLEYDEIVEIEIEESIKAEKNRRETLESNEAMQGFWLQDNQEHLYFTPDYIVQGDYKFQYKIKEVRSDYIYITAFKESRFSLKENKLFDLYLEFDNTRNNMRLKKEVEQLWSPPLIYKENMVYVSNNNYILGSFESEFFDKYN